MARQASIQRPCPIVMLSKQLVDDIIVFLKLEPSKMATEYGWREATSLILRIEKED